MPQIGVALPDGLNIYLNQQWVNYTGLSLEESYGNGWIKLFILTTKKVHFGKMPLQIILRILLNAECVIKMVLIFGG
jgi:hypothetical protein